MQGEGQVLFSPAHHPKSLLFEETQASQSFSLLLQITLEERCKMPQETSLSSAFTDDKHTCLGMKWKTEVHHPKGHRGMENDQRTCELLLTYSYLESFWLKRVKVNKHNSEEVAIFPPLREKGGKKVTYRSGVEWA